MPRLLAVKELDAVLVASGLCDSVAGGWLRQEANEAGRRSYTINQESHTLAKFIDLLYSTLLSHTTLKPARAQGRPEDFGLCMSTDRHFQHRHVH